MRINLKECPVCGEQPDYQSFNAGLCEGRIICSCGLELRQGRDEKPEAIAAIWNTRVTNDENAKLRKLARGMYGMLATFDAILGNHDACETPRPLIFGEDKSFKDVMRELGIEVDDGED